MIFLDALCDFLEGKIFCNERLELFCYEFHGTAGRKAVDHKNLPAGIGTLIIGFGNICGVVAAGEIAADGNAENIGLILKGIQPVMGGGTGGGGLAGVCQ